MKKKSKLETLLSYLRREKRFEDRERLNLNGIIITRNLSEMLLKIANDRTQEIIVVKGEPVFKRQWLCKDFKTADPYKPLDNPIFDARLWKSVVFHFWNDTLFDATVEITASIDGTRFKTVASVNVLQKGEGLHFQSFNFYPFYRFRAKSKDAGFPAIISGIGAGWR